MNAKDEPEFLKILNSMAVIKRIDLGDDVIELWWASMQRWSLADFREASAHLMHTLKWMPSPSDYNDLRKAARMTPGEAWLKAMANVHRSRYVDGQLVYPASDDPLVDLCVRMLGGYAAIGACDEDRLHFLERRFAEHYETLEARDDVRVALPRIADTSKPRPTAITGGGLKKIGGPS